MTEQMKERLERAVELATGEPIDVLRNRSLEENRELAETRHGRSMRVASAAPELLTHEQVEAEALKAEIERLLDGIKYRSPTP